MGGAGVMMCWQWEVSRVRCVEVRGILMVTRRNKQRERVRGWREGVRGVGWRRLDFQRS